MIIGVVGTGSMGSGIAQVAAQSGNQVKAYDLVPEMAGKALEKIKALTQKNVEKGKMTAEARDLLLANLQMVDSMSGFADADFVIEAVVEDPAVKKKVFSELAQICKPSTILGTNTSSISITSISAAVKNPDKVVGMHFFNPPQVMKLVEITRGYYTSDETVEATINLAESFGKKTVLVKRDSPGFIVNRLMFAQFAEAIRLVQEGVASMEDVDEAMRLGLNHPMGPFQLQDFTGVEVCLSVMEYLYTEMRQPQFATPELMKNIVRAGRYGRKTNAGWYDYSK